MEQKLGCTMGMGMTEKQGGSDLRRNTTRATRQEDGTYEIFITPVSVKPLVSY